MPMSQSAQAVLPLWEGAPDTAPGAGLLAGFC